MTYADDFRAVGAKIDADLAALGAKVNTEVAALKARLDALEAAPDPDPDPEPEPEPEPPAPTGDTAAVRNNWGAPTWSDDFTSGSIDSAKWQNAPVAGMPGHNRNGRRIASSTTVVNGVLTLHGYPNGDTGWIRQNVRTRYGRWEIRVRSRNIGGSGGLYHVLALIWPTSEQWPAGGEYDWLENFDPNSQKVGAFLHYPHPSMPVQQEYAEKTGVNANDWHNVAFEWTSTGLKGWVDGVQFYSFSGGGNASRSNIQAMPEGYLTLQLDNFTGNSGLREAVMEVDSVKFWKV